jgi:hypothetical protein
MANQSGRIYGLTILSPIKSGQLHTEISPSLAIRRCLRCLAQHEVSPFAKVSSTHMARLAVMDDVVYEGSPSCEEHLQAKYLVFESNFDGDLDTYLKRLASEAAAEVECVWQHCDGFPGVHNVEKFVEYMKKCQIETTFFFADVNNKTVQETLSALQTQSAVAAFIEKNQGKPPEELHREFVQFIRLLRAAPAPRPGSGPKREFSDEIT